MKSFMLLFLTMYLGVCTAQESDDLVAIEEAVQHFSSYGDQQDATKLDAVLHTDFRAVVNRVFGSEEVSLMDKATYLQLIQTGKIGGDERRVHLLDIEMIGNNATVKALLLGKKLRFTTFMSLVKNVDGSWQVIGDFPHIEQV